MLPAKPGFPLFRRTGCGNGNAGDELTVAALNPQIGVGVAIKQLGVLGKHRTDFPPEQVGEVIERRRGGGVDLRTGVAFVKPGGDAGGDKGLASGVAGPGYRLRVIPHRQQNALQVWGEGIAQLIAHESDGILLIFGVETGSGGGLESGGVFLSVPNKVGYAFATDVG